MFQNSSIDWYVPPSLPWVCTPQSLLSRVCTPQSVLSAQCADSMNWGVQARGSFKIFTVRYQLSACVLTIRAFPGQSVYSSQLVLFQGVGEVLVQILSSVRSHMTPYTCYIFALKLTQLAVVPPLLSRLWCPDVPTKASLGSKLQVAVRARLLPTVIRDQNRVYRRQLPCTGLGPLQLPCTGLGPLVPLVLTNSTLTGTPTDWMRLRLLLIGTRVTAVSAHLWGSALWLTVGDGWWQVVERTVGPPIATLCETLPEGSWQRGPLWDINA